jgi:DNA gyrase subunit A
MATNIPPHNLGELIDACCALIDNPELTTQQLMEYVPGPDFPTGAASSAATASGAAYELGRGSLIMRAKTGVEEIRGGPRGDHHLRGPYQENKARLHERIAEVVRDKKVEGVSEVRDESDRDGVRLVVELEARRHGRRGAEPALSLHAAADDLQRQFAGARWRPPRADDASRSCWRRSSASAPRS